MNVYWFILILAVLYKVVTGQTLEDVRDFKEEEEPDEVLQVLKPIDQDNEEANKSCNKKKGNRRIEVIREKDSKDLSVKTM